MDRAQWNEVYRYINQGAEERWEAADHRTDAIIEAINKQGDRIVAAINELTKAIRAS